MILRQAEAGSCEISSSMEGERLLRVMKGIPIPSRRARFARVVKRESKTR